VRVVSLVPSVTETLLAWGVDVVGCTRFCEQPGLRHVGGTKDPDVAAVAALAPDLVVVDREENRREDAAELTRLGLALHVMHVTDLAGLPDELAALAAATGAAAPRVVLPAAAAPWATAFTPIWRRPWMALGSGTYGSALLAHLGIGNVIADPADRYPLVDLAAVARLAPALVLLPSEPYPFRRRHADELAEVVPGARVELVDGQDLLWWGARTPAALERLRDVLRAAPPRP